jgi:hypothetical protein
MLRKRKATLKPEAEAGKAKRQHQGGSLLTSILTALFIFLIVFIVTRFALIMKFKNSSSNPPAPHPKYNQKTASGQKLEMTCMQNYFFSRYKQLCVEKGQECFGKIKGEFVLEDDTLYVCDGKDDFDKSYLCPQMDVLDILGLDGERMRILCGSGNNLCESVGDTKTLFADPRSTFSYIKCKHGVGVLTDCQTDHYFNTVHKNCQIIPEKCRSAALKRNKINTILFGRLDTICKIDGHSNIIAVETIDDTTTTTYMTASGQMCKSKPVPDELIPSLWTVSPYYYGCEYNSVEDKIKYTLTRCGNEDDMTSPINYIEPLHERVAHLSAMYFEFPQIRTKVFIKDRGCVTFDYKVHYKNGEVPLVYRYPLHIYHHLPLYKYSFVNNYIWLENRTSNEFESLDYSCSRFETPSGFATLSRMQGGVEGDSYLRFYSRDIADKYPRSYRNRNKMFAKQSSASASASVSVSAAESIIIPATDSQFSTTIVELDFCKKHKLNSLIQMSRNVVDFDNVYDSIKHNTLGDTMAIFTCLNQRQVGLVFQDPKSESKVEELLEKGGREESKMSNMFLNIQCSDIDSVNILFGVPFESDSKKYNLPYSTYNGSNTHKYAIGLTPDKYWVVADRTLTKVKRSYSENLNFKHKYCDGNDKKGVTFSHYGIFAIYRCDGSGLAEYIEPFIHIRTRLEAEEESWSIAIPFEDLGDDQLLFVDFKNKMKMASPNNQKEDTT